MSRGLRILLALGLIAPGIGRAQIDPIKRDLIQIGYNQPLEGQAPVAGYAFYYHNQPGFIRTNLTWRLALAPVYLDTELGILQAFGPQTDFALGAAGELDRVAGDPDRPVRRVAVCGGAGDFLLDAMARADADLYLTSDLRHHPASEFLEKDGPALVDVAHWAAEWTWLPVVEARLRSALGDTVETRVSTLRTDPWTFRV